jgi:zinc/manganese transport system substrate-binding protein
VLNSLQQHPAKMVLRAAYQDGRPSEWISQRAHIAAVELPYTVGGSKAANDLYGLFDDTIARLLAGLK